MPGPAKKPARPAAADDPLPGGGSRHRTHSLRPVGDHLLLLRPSASHKVFASLLMLLGGGVALFFGIYLMRDPQLINWLVTGAGVVFFLAGALVLLLVSRWEFDKRARTARRRWVFGGLSLPFARLRAIQFVDGGWHGGRSGQDLRYRTFQLNLVLDDGERVNLTNHAEWGPTWEVGNELAAFLELPILDEVSEEDDDQ